MDGTRAIKPEPASPASSGHEEDRDGSVHPGIKMETCYQDLHIEYDPLTAAEDAEGKRIKFTEMYIKVEKDDSDVSELRTSVVKTEPNCGDPGGHVAGDADPSHPDIKKECFQSSNGNRAPRRKCKTSAERAREYRARKRAKKPPKKPPKTRLQRNREWRERKKLQAKMLLDPELCFSVPSTSIVPHIVTSAIPVKESATSILKSGSKRDTDDKEGCKTNIKPNKKTKEKTITQKINECEVCKKTFKLRNNLNIHMLSHTGEKPYACSECDYRSSRSDVLKSHMLTHFGEKSFSCELCGYTCFKKSNLKHHTLSHTGEKSFSCSNCSYKCSRKDVLKSHMLTHTGEKPFSCTQCSYSCIRKGNLKYHMLSHTGQEPFSCSECSYTCFKKGNLTNHVQSHTGGKPFSCSECSYKCCRSDILKSHMLTHTSEKPFSRSDCSHTYTTKGCLKHNKLTYARRTPFSGID